VIDLRDILFCAPLRCESTALSGACARNARLRRASVNSRAYAAAQSRGLSPLHLFIFAFLSCSLTFTLCGCLGGTIISAAATSASSLHVSPNTVSFGGVALGTTASKTVSLQNQGSAAVTVSQVSVSGPAFSVSGEGDLPVTVAAGDTYSLSVNFSPRAAGSAAGQLTISSNATADGALTIGLSGLGTTESTANSPELSSFSCNQAAVTGAGSDICTVTVSAAAAGGGFVVNLTSNNSAVTVPASVTVAAGSNTASFSAILSAVSSAQTATLTASAGGLAENFAVQLNAAGQAGAPVPVLSGLSCSSGSMVGAGADSCTVTLNTAAAGGGFAVNLASNNSAVAVPATVTVAGGATTGSFTAAVSAVSSAQTATLTASAGGVAKTFVLQLGAGVPTLSINATSITFGNVNLNSPATQSLILTSTGAAAVTVSAATVIGTGFNISGAGFPITLKTNQTATLSVQFDPTGTGSASGTLTIVSTSLTSPIAIIGLSGTGVAGVAHQVSLSWDAPTNSPDPVAGYNVYRSPDGASTYQQLNTAVVTQTTYVDTAIQDGQTYDYIVESVDASGVTSFPSNMAAVPIP